MEERIINYRTYLALPIRQLAINKVVDSVSIYPDDFETIYRLIYDPDEKVSWRAAWACEKVFEKHPDFLAGKQTELIRCVMNSNHSGKNRILLSILLFLPVPTPLPVDFLDYCFERMLDLNQAIAVQALCIKMAYKLCLTEPELLVELRLYLENVETDYYSPAVKSCIRNILKKFHQNKFSL